jgi:hypothetical protein
MVTYHPIFLSECFPTELYSGKVNCAARKKNFRNQKTFGKWLSKLAFFIAVLTRPLCSAWFRLHLLEISLPVLSLSLCSFLCL